MSWGGGLDQLHQLSTSSDLASSFPRYDLGQVGVVLLVVCEMAVEQQ